MTTLPTIHLNGTGAQTLFDEYNEAWRALRAARDAFASTTCNGRDFYPQGETAYQDARYERAEAFAHLEDVIDYVEEWLTHISDHR